MVELARLRFAFACEAFGRRIERAMKTRFPGLWVAGSLAGLERTTVAVVGARAPSDAARARAEQLGEALARAGVCVVSGLALGMQGARYLTRMHRHARSLRLRQSIDRRAGDP